MARRGSKTFPSTRRGALQPHGSNRHSIPWASCDASSSRSAGLQHGSHRPVEVELDRTLLTGQPTERLVILALCALGMIGRHRIIPDDRARWDEWAGTLPADLAEEVRYAWD